MSAKVLVTGASGYIAGHVVQQLQEAGYKVRGTVRSLKNEDKVKHLYHLCPNATHKLELVEADLLTPESWPPAVEGVTYVLHVASPLTLRQGEPEDDFMKPAVEGTLSVLRACAQTPSVKRVVITSSTAAISSGPCGHTLTEEDWADVSKVNSYAKSKALAERAAWDFVASLPDENRFQLAVINPSFVVGPPLQGGMCASIEAIKILLERKMALLPRIWFNIVDVRDVALAHLRAMTLPEAAGHRHICSSSDLWFWQMAALLKAEFQPQGYDVPTTNAPYFLVWLASFFDHTLKLALPLIGQEILFDNSRMRQVLSVEPRDVRDSIIEMAYALIENGFVKKTSKYRGPGGVAGER